MATGTTGTAQALAEINTIKQLIRASIRSRWSDIFRYHNSRGIRTLILAIDGYNLIGSWRSNGRL